jgi:uncharacterized membrane protein
MTHTTFLRASLRQIAILAALSAASLLCLAMVAARITLSGSWRYVFLLWNLFLAWIPLLVSLAAYNSYHHLRRGWLIALGLAGVWLLFFPNAPYMITDLLHLRAADQVPAWFDVLLVAAFAWTSFLLGFVSLYLMQTLVSRAAGAAAGWVFAGGVLGLSAFGVYLGRFLRWNSWDVLSRPLTLLADIWAQVRHPLAHPRPLVFSSLLAFFLLTTYLVLVAFAHLPQEAHGTIRD